MRFTRQLTSLIKNLKDSKPRTQSPWALWFFDEPGFVVSWRWLNSFGGSALDDLIKLK
jgi:hypothetical protein